MFFISFFSLVGCNSDDGLKAFNSNPEATITSHTDGDELLEGVQLACAAHSAARRRQSAGATQGQHQPRGVAARGASPGRAAPAPAGVLGSGELSRANREFGSDLFTSNATQIATRSL